MKAISEACVQPTEVEIRTVKLSNIGRSKMEGHLHTSEMQACFQQLKQLVPTIPQGKTLSRTQLLQHVIDYILDLELALAPSVLSANIISSTSPTREPLTEKSEPNQIVSENICLFIGKYRPLGYVVRSVPDVPGDRELEGQIDYTRWISLRTSY